MNFLYFTQNFGKKKSSASETGNDPVPDTEDVFCFIIILLFILFYCYALCKVSRFVYVKSLGDAYVISQQLQWDDCQRGGEVWICLWNIDGEVCGIFDVVISKGGQSHQIRAAASAFYHVADCFFIERRLCENADDQCTLFDQ